MDGRSVGYDFVLDKLDMLPYSRMQEYSISEAARQLGVKRDTLYRWIAEKKIPAPRIQVVAGNRITFWTEADLEKLSEYRAGYYWGKSKKRSKSKKTAKRKKRSKTKKGSRKARKKK